MTRPVSVAPSPARWRPAFTVVAACALLVSCRDDGPAGGPPLTSVVDRSATVTGPIDIGAGRRLFAECRGVGSPTVVLISGKGNGGADWMQVLDPNDPAHGAPGDDVGAGLTTQHDSDDAVFPSVAGFTRVCTYDRPDTRIAGADLSTPREQAHPVDVDVDDLHAVLCTLGEPGPYVLVGHSYGGLIATLYARTYPAAVAGLVMVDAGTELIEQVVDPAIVASWDAASRQTSPQSPEGVMLADAFQQIAAAGPLPEVPAIVLTADKPPRSDLIPTAVAAQLPTFADWLASQELLASALGAEHITATDSGHNIYLYSPAAVVAAVRDVVDIDRDERSPTTDTCAA